MSNLYISEFSDLGITSNGALQDAAAQNWIDDQKIAIGSTSTPSNAFNAQTVMVELIASASCSIAWTQANASSVTAATASNYYLAANVPKRFAVSGGMILSVITNASP